MYNFSRFLKEISAKITLILHFSQKSGSTFTVLPLTKLALSYIRIWL